MTFKPNRVGKKIYETLGITTFVAISGLLSIPSSDKVESGMESETPSEKKLFKKS